MKIITIAGNVGKGAEVRTTQGGDSFAAWTVAVEERGKEKRTLWFDVTLWGKRGEALQPYIRKGDKITVVGELSRREHDGKTYLTVRAAEVTLQGGKRDDDREERRDGGGSFGGERRDLDDDIPF